MSTADEQSYTSPPAYKIERVLRVTHSLNYRYSHPIHDVTTRLRLLPPEIRGAQRVRDSKIHIAPEPIVSQRLTDPFGNRVLEVRHEKIWEHLTLVVDLEVENVGLYSADDRVVHGSLSPSVGLPLEGATALLAPTPLTTPDNSLEAVAAEIRGDHSGDLEGLAFAFCRRVYAEMHYTQGATNVRTTAAEAWTMRRGVCQDYAHILLALCRLADLPARYVSGFLPGEGAMHAWVEVLLPAAGGKKEGASAGHGWAALDPTHDRWVNERYVTVAVGRDYADITPTSGTFTGKAKGPLSHRSRVVVEKTVETRMENEDTP